MQIVDAHHHLWDLGKLHYPWIVEPIDHPVGDYAAIRRSYRIADLLDDAANQPLVKSVHLQAEVDHADPVAETAWLQSVADDPASRGLPNGIVAYADLAAPDADDVLARHCAHANMRGIRHMLNYDAHEPRFCFAPAWRSDAGRSLARRLCSAARPRPHVRHAAVVAADDRRGAPGRRLPGHPGDPQPRRHAAAARLRIRRRLAPRHASAGGAAERRREDLRPRHVRPRLDDRFDPACSSRTRSSCSASSAACSPATSRSTS